MVKSEIKCSWRAPEALRKDFNSKEMAELSVTPTICLVPLAKTYQSPARREGGLSPWVLSSSSLSQKSKMAFPFLDTNYWFKKCFALCCRLEKSPHCPGKCFESWVPSSFYFQPRGASSQSLPFQSWQCQLPAEVRVKVCSFCRGIWACVRFLGCGKCKEFLVEAVSRCDCLL